MKTLITILAAIGMSSSAIAATLNCSIIENGTVTYTQTVETILNQKVRFASTGAVTAYVTEKAHSNYEVEAFLAQSEVRIYGQGSLRTSSDLVGSSLWAREFLIEIQCGLAKFAER
jgi:hypothetical protein